MGELFVALTGKIRMPLSIREGVQRVEHHMQIWPVLTITAMVILEAFRGVNKHHFRYWDSLIWATAKLNQVELVLSEDFADGSKVEGVRFVNPFTAEFEISDWL
jgi:predicted nucleic acid-binding protein